MAKTTRSTTVSHKTGSRKDWLAARLKLLRAEKELTHKSDAVARQRQALPWVRVEKDYRFETGEGHVGLADLFRGRSQLLIYHFMFGPDFTAGCPACSSIADSFNGIVSHLAHHDVMLWAVSRAPFTKLATYQKRMGWTFPWASSFESDFNFDYSVGFTETQQFEQGIDYNYEHEKPLKAPGSRLVNARTTPDGPALFASMCGTDAATFIRERPGMSSFAMENGVAYHTYSSYARGLDGLWNMYQWLDRAPKGRNETGLWFKRHDEYNKLED